MHENWGDEESKVFDIKRGKRFRKKTLQFMIEKNHLTPHSNYLCMGWCKKAEKMIVNHQEADINQLMQVWRLIMIRMTIRQAMMTMISSILSKN